MPASRLRRAPSSSRLVARGRRCVSPENRKTRAKFNHGEHEAGTVSTGKKTRVGVIYGGRSGEHEVSLASAAAVFKNLDPERYEAVPIKIEKDGRWTLPDRPPQIEKAADVIKELDAPAGSSVRLQPDRRA